MVGRQKENSNAGMRPAKWLPPSKRRLRNIWVECAVSIREFRKIAMPRVFYNSLPAAFATVLLVFISALYGQT
jgi:hypothetical protein